MVVKFGLTPIRPPLSPPEGEEMEKIMNEILAVLNFV
jgi:hypothetical protein